MHRLRLARMWVSEARQLPFQPVRMWYSVTAAAKAPPVDVVIPSTVRLCPISSAWARSIAVVLRGVLAEQPAVNNQDVE